MKEFKITEQTLTELMNYLATRPFVEVFKLINDVQNDIKKGVENGPTT